MKHITIKTINLIFWALEGGAISGYMGALLQINFRISSIIASFVLIILYMLSLKLFYVKFEKFLYNLTSYLDKARIKWQQ